MLAVTVNQPTAFASGDWPATPANNFSCGDLNTGHCYALERWGTTYGSFTIETVVNLSCTCNWWWGGESGFVNNEMWVVQDGNSACINSRCWVEAGFGDTGGIGGSLHYFWADSRPNGGYNGHDLDSVPSGDLNGNLYLYIKQINSNTWDADLMSNSKSYYEQSTSNNMVPNRTDMGTELAGTGTLSAPTDTWSLMANYSSISNWNAYTIYVGPPAEVDSPLKLDYNTSNNTFDTHCC